MDIEKLATSTITDFIAGTDYLSPWINDGDKEPTWDGSIYAYSNKSKKKRYLEGRAPVQVKGKLVSKLSKRTIKYPVSRVDLENFRNDGGALFFVVAITADREKKIYYAALLPFLINTLLDVHKNTQKPSLTFKEFPMEINEIENIVLNFVRDMKKQSIVKNGKKWTIDEVADMIGPENLCLDFSFTCIGYDRNDPFSYLKNNEVYMYAGTKDKSLLIPVEHMNHVELQVRERNINISANEALFYTTVREERHRDDSIAFCMGKSFRFVMRPGGEASFSYTLSGDLDERIQDISFLLAVYAGKGFCFNGVKIDLNICADNFPNDTRKDFEAKLKYLKLVKEALARLNVSKPLEIENLSDKEEEYIKLLINTQLYRKRATFKEKEVQPIITLNIGNLHLIMLLTKHNDGSYYVDDFFQKEIECTIDKSEKAATSQFAILSKMDYLQADNLVIEKVAESFKKHNNPSNYDRCNLSILEMLRAYDEDEKRKDLLTLSEILCEWLVQEDPQNDIYRLNLLQCHLRRGVLCDDEILELNLMSQKQDNNEALNAGIQILLGNSRLAQIYIDKISDEKVREEFLEYPIYHLMKRG